MAFSRELTQAGVVVWVNGPWNDSREQQGNGRVRRRDPVRNYSGRKLVFINLMIDHPQSIDIDKERVRKWKAMLSNMLVDGHMTPEIIDTFNNLEDMIAKRHDDIEDLTPDGYELTLMDRFNAKVGEILDTPSTDVKKLDRLWKELSEMYALILEHKASFFGNRANHRHLSKIPELKGRKLKFLDAGSGPSTGLRAYWADLEAHEKEDFHLDIIDADSSEAMLRKGVEREGGQIEVSIDNFHQLAGDDPDFAEELENLRRRGIPVGPESYDIINIAYAWRYAARPARTARAIKKLLKPGGIWTMILPSQDFIPPTFLEKLQEMGFSIMVGEKGELKSKLSEDDIKKLTELYGEEVAADMADQAKATFTYLVVKKTDDAVSDDIQDDDLRVARRVPKIDKPKLKRIQKKPGRYMRVPAGAIIDEEVKTQPEPAVETVRQARKLLRPYTNVLRDLHDAAVTFQTLSGRPGLREDTRLERLQLEIYEGLDRLKDMIEHPPIPLPSEKQEELINGFEKLQTGKMTRHLFANEPRITQMVSLLMARSPLTTPRTRSAVARLFAMKGLGQPSEWRLAWIAAKHEYRLSRQWSRFISKHEPKTKAHAAGLALGLSAVWAATLLIPTAVMALLTMGVGGVGGAILGGLAAGVAWLKTEKQANIAAHGLLNTFVIALRNAGIGFGLSQWFVRRYLAAKQAAAEQVKNDAQVLSLSDALEQSHKTVAENFVYRAAAVTGDLLREPGAPTEAELQQSRLRILTSA
jgi:SAM-dependent methyltransferase